MPRVSLTASRGTGAPSFQGVVLACVYGVQASNNPDASPMEREARNIMVEAFAHLVSQPPPTSVTDVDGGASGTDVMDHMYAATLEAIMQVLEKLDLSAFVPTDGDARSQSATAAPSSQAITMTSAATASLDDLRATRAKDFQVCFPPSLPDIILQQLVEFTTAVLRQSRRAPFRNWYFLMAQRLVRRATQHPYVSGLYALLTTANELAEELGLLNEHQKLESFLENHVTLMGAFCATVMRQCKQFKDELLTTCLRFLVTCPTVVVKSRTEVFIEALDTSLRLGIGYLPLAEAALASLQRWLDVLGLAALQPHLAPLLRRFDQYLTAQASATDDLNADAVITDGQAKRTQGGAARSKPGAVEDDGLAPLDRVKGTIVTLLGQFGLDVSHHLALIGSPEDAEAVPTWVAWSASQTLPLTVPFPDIKPSIKLAPLLPRIVDLATNAGDRQTRTAACELLHAIVLYILGREAVLIEDNKDVMTDLWRHIFPVMIQLSCDLDSVPQQLFELLTLQVVRWFTDSRMYEYPNTVALITAILDALCDASNTNLREFAARCVAEFFTFALRRKGAENPERKTALTSLLLRIRAMAAHPSIFQRLGAALAMRTIYRKLRESAPLVSVFGLDLTVAFLTGLQHCENDPEGAGTSERLTEVVMDCKRMLIHHAGILNKPERHRRGPASWPQAVLSNLVAHCFGGFGWTSAPARHAAIDLFMHLVTKIPGPDGHGAMRPQQYLTRPVGGFTPGLIENLKRGQVGDATIATSHLGSSAVLRSLRSRDYQEAAHWLRALAACLEGYHLIIKHGLVSPETLATMMSSEQCTIVPALHEFQEALLGSGTWLYTHLDAALRDIVCGVLVRNLRFIEVVLRNPALTAALIPRQFLNAQTMKMISTLLFNPAHLGFNAASQSIMAQLQQVLGQTLDAVAHASTDSAIRQELEQDLATWDEIKTLFPLKLAQNMGAGHERSLTLLPLARRLATGYQLLQATGLLKGLLPKPADQVAKELVQSLFLQTQGRLHPSSKETGLVLLELAFSLYPCTDALLACLLDEETVLLATPVSLYDAPASATQGIQQSKGLRFYETFRTCIAGFVARHTTVLMPDLALTAAADLARYRREALAAFMRAFPTLHEALSDQPRLLVRLVEQASRCGLPLAEVVAGLHPTAFRHVCADLESNSTLAEKADSRQLIGVLCSVPAVPLAGTEDLMPNVAADSVRKMCGQFPFQSSEYGPGTTKRRELVATLNDVFRGLVVSGAEPLFKVVLELYVKEGEAHVHHEGFVQAFSSFAAQTGRAPVVASVLRLTFRVAVDLTKPEAARNALAHHVLPALLEGCDAAVRRDFYREEITAITAMLSSKHHSDTAGWSREVACQLLAQMFRLLPVHEVYGTRAAVNQAFHDQAGLTGAVADNCLTKAVVDSLRGFLQDKTTQIPGLTNFPQTLKQKAFNTLFHVLDCTQTDPAKRLKFFTTLCFESKKGPSPIVCVAPTADETFEFKAELDQAPTLRLRQLTALRSSARTQHGTRYLTSQLLADSSLSQSMASWADPNGASSLEAAPVPGAEAAGAEVEPPKPTEAKNLPEPMDLELDDDGIDEDRQAGSTLTLSGTQLELDALNRHPNMLTMLALVEQMLVSMSRAADESGSAAASALRSAEEAPAIPAAETLPAWMSELLSIVNAAHVHMNQKLFIAKVIINQPQHFQPWAKWWLAPLMRMAVALGDRQAEPFNYFVTDLCVVLLRWSETAVPGASDVIVVQQFIEFLVRHAQHESGPIFRNNLTIIKTFVEKWGAQTHAGLTMEVLCEFAAHSGISTKRLRSSLHLFSVALANGIYPTAQNLPPAMRLDGLCNQLAGYLTHKSLTMCRTAASVIGMYLQCVYDGSEDGASDTAGVGQMLTQATQRCLMDIKRDSAEGRERFVTALHAICNATLGYPAFVDELVQTLLYVLPACAGNAKTQALEVLMWRATAIPDLFRELLGKDLPGLLQRHAPSTQCAVLTILKAILPSLEPSVVQRYFPALIAHLPHHDDAQVRLLHYQLLMVLYDLTLTAELKVALGESNTVQRETLRLLVMAFSDESAIIRRSAEEFFDQETRLSIATDLRLCEVLDKLYVPASEGSFLSTCSSLLLRLTARSPDYERQLFEQALKDCERHPLRVDVTWQRRNLHLTPLFSQSSLDASLEATLRQRGIRATQASYYSFSQTQSFRPGAAPADSLRSAQNTQTQFTDSQRVLLVTRRRPRAGTLAGTQVAFSQSEQDHELAAAMQAREKALERREIGRLRRRFLQTKEGAQTAFWARQATRQRLERQARAKERRQARHANVVLYRDYKDGELPDIQIKQAELIRPLVALTQRDTTFARSALVELVTGLLNAFASQAAEADSRQLLLTCADNFAHLLQKSRQGISPVIAMATEVLYSLDDDTLRELFSRFGDLPANLCRIAVASDTMPLAALLLERHLMLTAQHPSSGPASKRRKQLGDADPFLGNFDSWLELGRLYNTLSEFDTLHGIFSRHGSGTTRQAFACLAHDDYLGAIKAVDEAGDAEVDLAEEELWQQIQLSELFVDESTPDEDVLEAASLERIWTDRQATALVDATMTSNLRDGLHHVLSFLNTQLFPLRQETPKEASVAFYKLREFVTSSSQQPMQAELLARRHAYELAVTELLHDKILQESEQAAHQARARHLVNTGVQAFEQSWPLLPALQTGIRLTRVEHVQPLIELDEYLDFMGTARNFEGSAEPMEQLARRWRTRDLTQESTGFDAFEGVFLLRSLFLGQIALEYSRRHSAILGDHRAEDFDLTDSTDAASQAKRIFVREQAQHNYRLALKAVQINNPKQSSQYFRLAEDLVGLPAFSRDDMRDLLLLKSQARAAHNNLSLRLRMDRGSSPHALVQSILRCLDAYSDQMRFTSGNSEVFSRTSLIMDGAGTLVDVARALHLLERPQPGTPDLDEQQTAMLLEAAHNAGLKLHADAGALAGQMAEQALRTAHEACRQLATDVLHGGTTIPLGYYRTESSTQAGAFAFVCSVTLQRRRQMPDALCPLDVVPDMAAVPIDNVYPERAARHHVRFADFCFQALAQLEAQPTSASVMPSLAEEAAPPTLSDLMPAASSDLYGRSLLLQLAVEHSFAAARSGLAEGRALLPRVLALLEVEEERPPWLPQLICAAGCAAPAWIYLRWLPQLLAYGATDQNVLAVKQILGLVAKAYPQAVAYPAILLQDQLEERIVSNDVHGCFDFIKNRISGQDEKSALLIEKRLRFGHKVFGSQAMKRRATDPKIISTLHAKLEQWLSKPDKLKSMTMQKSMVKELGKCAEGLADAAKDSSTLSTYAPQLAESMFTGQMALEVPGQYGEEDSMPDVQSHVMLCGFDSRVLVLKSIRRPKRVTMLGSDEREYKFLVKAGEDLRTDDRIEQVFSVMNRILAHDRACQQRRLNLRTYAVIPMTTRLGLLEWMDNTTTLRDFVMQSDEDEKDIQRAKETYLLFANKFADKRAHSSVADNITRVLVKGTRSDVKLAFEKAQSMHYGRTLSTINICQYILGIGDRHLSNVMVDLRTGGLIGIDFGHHFGSATYLLPIPELMPFRLTRIMEQALQPHTRNGLIKHVMCHVLTALKARRSDLLAVIQIFATEPTLDWQQNAKKVIKQEEGEELQVENYATRNLERLRLKLSGCHPAAIMAEEVADSRHIAAYRSKVQEVVWGSRRDQDLRATLPTEVALTVEQQVDALLDQATDPNLLGRSWVGWDPYC
ncbi:uncharacterized protein MONBRDRAFT_30238 [Monosiga brevicollis MX1]|uniref:Uncharacterized protein n=1 Tax=Monosiga brevicollis TaxID=81824 RepID=A9VDE0_MONBE|nr:uncharacterized protein MONBRDRAFT_30238 [Monosiga brevicollis MX1]EDQ84433.1 predicted protein [Monosiga brevicollis MX1]|eukprot:XP_001750728.1 hypothetical protein [Monosiga brevicollis MX1]